jgi:hypothetical protein
VNRNFARRANLSQGDGQPVGARGARLYSEWFNHFRITVHSIGSLHLRDIVSQTTQLRIEAPRTGTPLTCAYGRIFELSALSP